MSTAPSTEAISVLLVHARLAGKLGVRDRSDIVRIAPELGLLS